MTNSVLLTKTVHDSLMALGTRVAITLNKDGYRGFTLQEIRNLPRLYNLAAKYMLVGHEIDLEAILLTSDLKHETDRLETQLRALPRSAQGSASKLRLSEISVGLLGKLWTDPANWNYRYVDEVAKYRLSEEVQSLDWCNKTWSRLCETGASEVEIADCFTAVSMTGMRSRCPVQEFPSQWWVLGNTRTLDELKVIGLSASIREKQGWRSMLREEHVVSRWREEAYAQNVTLSMFDYMVAELSWLAEQMDPETGIDYATVPGVFFSDSLIPGVDRDALRSGAELLSAVPESEKDWHPRSNGQVLDLVHPSLYPYVHARTPLLQRPEESQKLPCKTNPGESASNRDATAISILRSFRPPTRRGLIPSLGSALSFMGEGSPTSKPMSGSSVVERKWTTKYQWLPVDVEVPLGPVPAIQFLSYINNLHPGSSPGVQLYPVLERILGRFMPLFERALTETRRRRTGDAGARAEFLSGPVRNIDNYWDIPRPQEPNTYDEDATWYGELEYYLQNRKFVRPVVAPFVAPRHPGTAQVTLGGRTLQVIVKMANVHLSPDKPVYEGGSWHVEGTDSEQIVAIGIYYYESENIQDTSLEFRQAVQEPAYELHEFDNLKHLYGMVPEGATNQHLGAVGTPEGRCICFPNGMQHRLSSFKLIDNTKPGHRKILVFFLVDPSERIISTSDVPPQQLEWLLQEIRLQNGTRLADLPMELFEMICKHVRAEAAPTDEKPATGLMTHSEAQDHRLTLMDERGSFVMAVNADIYERGFNLCEH